MRSILLIEQFTECGTCMEAFIPPAEVAILGCNPNHFFHPDCIQEWITFNKNTNRTPTCPLCRVEIDESKIKTKNLDGFQQEPDLTRATP